MFRRSVRERRDYLYRKSLEDKEKAQLDKRRRLRAAIQGPCSMLVGWLVSHAAAGKPIPTELRSEAHQLQRDLAFDDENSISTAFNKDYHVSNSDTEYKDSRDDEYRFAGSKDPKILLTTSRDPSSRLNMFAKVRYSPDIGLFWLASGAEAAVSQLPAHESRKPCYGRGAALVLHLHYAWLCFSLSSCVAQQMHLISLSSTNIAASLVDALFAATAYLTAAVDGLVVCHMPYGPTAYFSLANVVMRHDIPDAGTMSEAYPHLIFNGFSTGLGERVTNILKYLFPVPKDDSKRVVTFSNDADYISFRFLTWPTQYHLLLLTSAYLGIMSSQRRGSTLSWQRLALGLKWNVRHQR